MLNRQWEEHQEEDLYLGGNRNEWSPFSSREANVWKVSSKKLPKEIGGEGASIRAPCCEILLQERLILRLVLIQCCQAMAKLEMYCGRSELRSHLKRLTSRNLFVALNVDSRLMVLLVLRGVKWLGFALYKGHVPWAKCAMRSICFFFWYIEEAHCFVIDNCIFLQEETENSLW